MAREASGGGETKTLLRAVAAQKGLPESVVLRQLIDTVLGMASPAPVVPVSYRELQATRLYVRLRTEIGSRWPVFLTCERCGARLVVTSKPPRYASGTFLYGGAAACPVSATARLENVESAILEPVRSVLLSDEAVESFCREIRHLHSQDASEPDHTWAAAERSLAEELEDLESLIKTRPARSATLAPVIEELRQKQSSLRRAAAHRRASRDELDLPAEREYRAAVTDINRALREGSVETARGALRALIGEIPVFQTGKTLAARLTMRPDGLFRNPDSVLLVGSGGRI